VSVPPPRKKRAAAEQLESPSTSARGSSGRRGKKLTQAIPAGHESSEYMVNKFIVIEPDDESLAEDAAVGYTLPLSIGRVVEVDMAPDIADGPLILVEWLFSESFSGKWRVWLERRKPRTTWLALAEVQRDDTDAIVFVTFTASDKSLSASSKRTLRMLIGDKCFDNHDNNDDYGKL
jgi:hypothetical protein